MGITKDVVDGLRAALLLTERVSAIAGQIKAMAADMRDIDRRLIRVETTIEVLMRGAFSGRSGAEDAARAAAPPRLGGPTTSSEE
ncbi:MAG: hypothetical protein ACLQJR_27240 [Stellaceae bacterium]